ncbi:hypothetical protein GUJ93_ZPchr0010g7632 [Zizania palustris]|uniref:Uncharacterized protein n=1 Tax=Zizania palustris TaxID=103762 RepID=A0A8J6BIR8_ZIZPA|nr:hypothetical protein GUJ93_ZPchr0010g7632 [Zizania palustris]
MAGPTANPLSFSRISAALSGRGPIPISPRRLHRPPVLPVLLAPHAFPQTSGQTRIRNPSWRQASRFHRLSPAPILGAPGDRFSHLAAPRPLFFAWIRDPVLILGCGRGLVVEVNRIGGDAEEWLAVEVNWSGGGLHIILIHGCFDLGRGGELTLEANRIGGGLLLMVLWLVVLILLVEGRGLTDVEVNRIGGEGWRLAVEMNRIGWRYLRCVVWRSFTVRRNYSASSWMVSLGKLFCSINWNHTGLNNLSLLIIFYTLVFPCSSSVNLSSRRLDNVDITKMGIYSLNLPWSVPYLS